MTLICKAVLYICTDLNLDEILSIAMEKKYYRSIQEIFKSEIENPSDEFTSFFAKQMTEKRMTSAVLEEFKNYIKKSFKEIINDLAYEKITSIKNNLQNINDDENDEQIDEKRYCHNRRRITRFLYSKINSC